MEKGQPNAESMLDGLSVVAHIPVFEEKILADLCLDVSKCRKLNEYEKRLLKDKRDKTRKNLELIAEHCKRFSDIHMSYADNGMLDVIKSMIELGKSYDSEWFVRRAECYAENYKMYPQMWMPPALTDWLYIESDYQKFLDNKGDDYIQMPKKK